MPFAGAERHDYSESHGMNGENDENDESEQKTWSFVEMRLQMNGDVVGSDDRSGQRCAAVEERQRPARL